MDEREKVKLPPVTFIGFVTTLANTALAYMGGLEDAQTKKPIIDLDLARHTIDTLDMLKEKTKGNLTKEEENYLENVLFTLKMTFVRISDGKEREDENRSDIGHAHPSEGGKTA
ncbi:TPA: DUF1844 domain-containing protein [Candidatus Poribacteria bacterium]|nr:DUF1844 domain-containing protein [Candidatus Poribacteria bacterium]